MSDKTPSPVTPAAPAPAGNNDVTALLLDVLRNVNREVKSTLALSTAAQAAILHFRAIAISLRTLADPAAGNAGPGLSQSASPGAAPRSPTR